MAKKTKVVRVGKVLIGGGNPVVIQSMTKISAKNIPATIKQIKGLQKAGCQLVRLAVKDMLDAKSLRQIKKTVDLPLIADIHFDYQLALAAIEAGVDKIRINPGTIGNKEELELIVRTCKEKKIPIRIGINSGSLEKEILKKHKKPTAKALVESALKNIKLLEKFGFNDIIVSLKSSNVVITIEAYKLLASKTNYPLHIGITEAGISEVGLIKSAIGLGILLSQGIGDTMRVSLTGDSVDEVIAAKEILKALDLLHEGVEVISCPVCGRCRIDVKQIAEQFYEQTRDIKAPLTVAIMGCEVNGPGEAKEADIALIGGDKQAMILHKGKLIKNVKEKDIVMELINIIKNYVK